MKNLASKIRITLTVASVIVLLDSCKVIEPFDPTPFALETKEKERVSLDFSDTEREEVSLIVSNLESGGVK
ncbi:hypothetical protein [Shivajiella indica]|uniref:Uncharacterized protein n=1 Tax=Shivajiella indica TaxID=872115 RepID=A0ABW5B2B9_9BACT